MNIFLFAVAITAFLSLSSAADDVPATVDPQEFHVLFIKHGIAYQLIQTNYFDNVLICLLADRRLRGSLRGSMAELSYTKDDSHYIRSKHTYEDFKQLIKALRSPTQKGAVLPQAALLFSFTKKECAMRNLLAPENDNKTLFTPEEPTLIAVNMNDTNTTYDTSFYNEAEVSMLAACGEQEYVTALRDEYVKECKCDIALEINCKPFQERCVEGCFPEHHLDFYAEISKQEKEPPKRQRCDVL